MSENNVPSVTVISKEIDEKNKKEYNKRMEIAVNVISNILSRYRNLNDPGMRHMMFVDKLYIVLDVMLGAFESVDEVTPEVKQKIDKLIDETKKDLNDLSKWIMSAGSNNTNTDDDKYVSSSIKSKKVSI